MGIAEKYSKSINSSDLTSDEHHYDTDNLAAVALCGNELGAALFRVKFGNDETSHKALLRGWQVEVAKKRIIREWPKHITANKVAELSLGYWLNDICEACSGKGFESVAGTPMLSDTPCKCCKGSTKKPLVCEANWRDYIMDMVESLEVISIHAGDVAIRKLASDMDF
jgi:hypothetical protein